jgi:hypothetical protein
MSKRNRFAVEEALIIIFKCVEPGIPLMDELMNHSANELPDLSKEPLHHHSPAEQANNFHFYKAYTSSLHFPCLAMPFYMME